LEIELASETCGGVPPAAAEWLRGVVEQAVLVEFDRFIAEGQLAARMADLGRVEDAGSMCGFAGMGV
jgi:hypothetical protein